MDKAYIEREYKQAISDFKCSHNEDEQWECRKAMAKLEQIAVEFYGFDYLKNTLEQLKQDLLQYV